MGLTCPFRFRCLGCDHFRTDPSYLPDLRAYLDTLLRDQERLAAADELDAWARAEATPSEEEISRLRRLIRRVESDLDNLTDEEREEIRQATSVLRRSRTVQLGMPTLRPAAGGLRLEREACNQPPRPTGSPRPAPTTPPAAAGTCWPRSTT
ncbi:transposase [Streptomyces sp. NPDC048473]|uniref:transposase n=1 Tax=unclassified Streptomyces TaxID=2593676 RepID=UPI0037211CED